MPKKGKQLEDFSGGVNTSADPQNIADNELAHCSGFKTESGSVIVLGDMKAAYSLGSHSVAGENINIEAGYGIFTFSGDYDKDGNLAATNYFVIQNGSQFNIYDTVDNAWVDNQIDLGGANSDNAMSTVGGVKPCFFYADGALRVSPGNFAKVDSGANLNSEALTATNVLTAQSLDTANGGDLVVGDLAVIDGIEVIVAYIMSAANVWFWRNLTGSFPGITADDSDIYVVPDTRWYGIVDRRNFQAVTTLGTFTEWYSTYMHVRAPVDLSMNLDLNDSIHAFQSGWAAEADNAIGDKVPRFHMGLKDNTVDTEATWDSRYEFYVTALDDETKQESSPAQMHQIGGSTIHRVIAAGKELAVWIGISYSDDGSNYEINKRLTGARVYYQDTISDDNDLYQLIEIDFVKGCKKVDEEIFHDWVRWAAADAGSDSDFAVACPASDGAINSTRTGTSAMVFKHPPKLLTYEINAAYPADANTHARFKTAVVANRRLYAGNVYQGGKAYGDRILYSPVNKFDLLPEVNALPLAIGDGDEIVKLATFADRILSFKKRTLYIINIGGGALSAFIESQHANMGVENPCQVCDTEYGTAWVNKFGVFLYDGQKVVELTRGRLQVSNSTRGLGLNIVESLSPLIGYQPLNKWVVVHVSSEVSGSYEAEAWIYDFKNGSWTWSQEFTADADFKTNMIATHDNELVFAAGTNSSDTPDFFKYRDTGVADPAQDKLFLLTKDFTLDIPSVGKNLYGVSITYESSGDSKMQVDFITTSASGIATITGATSSDSLYHVTNGFQTTGGVKKTVEIKPSSSIKKVNSFQLKIDNDHDAYDSSACGFKLYNITFIYRDKSIR